MKVSKDEKIHAAVGFVLSAIGILLGLHPLAVVGAIGLGGFGRELKQHWGDRPRWNSHRLREAAAFVVGALAATPIVLF